MSCGVGGPREASSDCVLRSGHGGEHVDDTNGSWPVAEAPRHTPESTPTEREAGDVGEVAAVLAGHGPSGFVNSREGWIECDCGARLPISLDGDGYAVMDEEIALWANHRADVLAPLIAEREAKAWELGHKAGCDYADCIDDRDNPYQPDETREVRS